MALTFFRSMLIFLSLIINSIKLVFLIKNLYFLIATSICSSYSLFKTHLIYSLYSSLFSKQIIILLRYAIINLSRCSSNTLLICFQNVAGIFVSLNYITNSLYSPSFDLKAAFYLLPSLILIWWYAHLRSIFIKIFILPILSWILLIKGKGYLFFLVMLFNYLQSIYILSFLFFFRINNTGYPTNNCNGLIYPFYKFSLINSLSATNSILVSLQIRKNFRLILSSNSILQSYTVYSAFYFLVTITFYHTYGISLVRDLSLTQSLCILLRLSTILTQFAITYYIIKYF